MGWGCKQKMGADAEASVVMEVFLRVFELLIRICFCAYVHPCLCIRIYNHEYMHACVFGWGCGCAFACAWYKQLSDYGNLTDQFLVLMIFF